MTKNRSRGRSRSWAIERVTVHKPGSSKPQSNKYRPNADPHPSPAPGTRSRYWRGRYTRKNGTHVSGHYVNIPENKK